MTSDMLGNSRVQRRSTARWRQAQALRHGYTTAACAAAAARAATWVLLTGKAVETVTLDLPAEKQVTFAITTCEVSPERATCATVKDAGDDPDVTNGAEIRATVQWSAGCGVTIAGGEGVGVVTRPGLPVPVGEPAINPGPRRLIEAAVREVAPPERGLLVTISVPNGQAIAEQTLNPRLGIVGGLSILGASGIVRPYSNSAYRATIRLALRVAHENGAPVAVLSTGSRSESYARQRYPELEEVGFVQVADHMDCGLRQAAKLRFQRVIIATMVGKASKLARGCFQTHVSEGPVDLAALAAVAAAVGADAGLQASVRQANTVHHAQNLLRAAGITGLEQQLAALAARAAATYAGGRLSVAVLVYGLDGTLLGAAEEAAAT